MNGWKPFAEALFVMRASDVTRNLNDILHAPASWAWAAAVVGIQIAVEALGGPALLGSWFENLGLSRDGFLSGKIWQILTHGMLHGGWWHAGLNALFVLVVGSRIEHMTGHAVMTRCALFGILGGGICHLLLGSGLLVGLSGACFALLLLLTTLSPQSRMFPIPVSGRSLGAGLVLAALILALTNPDLGLPGFSAAGRTLADHGMESWFKMGHACHLGGGLAGWAYGRWILRPRVTLARLQRERELRERR